MENIVKKHKNTYFCMKKISKEVFSEIFTNEWDTENMKKIVNHFIKNMKAKEKMNKMR